MPELLIELFSEEIPARMQAQAARDLERMAAEHLKKAGLEFGGVRAFAGPRRLTVVMDGVPASTPDRSEEIKGPKASAPPQALDGFLRKTGLNREQLIERDGVLFAEIAHAGRPAAEIVAEMLEAVLKGFPWPKSMRWGTGSFRWVRPLKRILCLLDGQVVPFEIAGVKAGDLTEGHRFMGEDRQPIRVTGFEQYKAALAAHFVVLEQGERKRLILDGARAACAAKGLELVEDEGLLDEVSGLAEWPVPILGDMDPAFLDLPGEVIRTSMRTHQKYFAVRKPGESALAPHFVVVANIEAADGGAIVAAGNAKVLSARLNDARFFWTEDRKVPLESRIETLKGVTFHAKLGTLAERVERIEALAREIAPLVGANADLAAKAARLCKADLATGMVGEFPELQGVMGGYYARLEPSSPLRGRGQGEGGVGGTSADVALAPPPPTPSPQGGGAQAGAPERFEGEADGSEDPLSSIEDLTLSPAAPLQAWWTGLSKAEVDQVADAVRDHYKPIGPSDSVPTAPVTVAVALADKLDTLVGFFAIDEKPTGSRDPFALRRAALGYIRIILNNSVRGGIETLQNTHTKRLTCNFEDYAWAVEDLTTFIIERLTVRLRESGGRHDLVEAAMFAGGEPDNDLVRIVRRVEALSEFLATEDGTNLLAGYKRAVNILKAEAKKGEDADLELNPELSDHAPAEEAALVAALRTETGRVDEALGKEDFTAAMRHLAHLRAPVDAFFDKVLVNDPDPAVRLNRLRLLTQVRDTANRVADFSLISG